DPHAVTSTVPRLPEVVPMPDEPRQSDDNPLHISQGILKEANVQSISIGAITQTVSFDVAALAGVLEARYKDQLAELRAREAADQDQIRALTETVTALAQQRTQPDAPPGIDNALAELSQGRAAAAEAIFESVVARKASDIQEAAKAFYHLGTLAFLHDTFKAL